MSIQKVFDQGRSGLSTSQKSLSVTGHNIANVNTEGYSRQRVEVETVEPTDFGRARVGSGARVQTVSRAHSDFITRRLETEMSDLSSARATTSVYSQIENLFANDAEAGLSKTMTNFFNDVRSLTTDPTSMPMRAAVVESAKNVARDFNRISDAVEDARLDLDNRVQGTVLNINGLTKRIADLNRRIMSVEGTHGVANDEKDQRDLAVRELAGLIDIQVNSIENGGVNVSSGRMGTLVSGVDNTELDTIRSPTESFPDAVKVVVRSSNSSYQDFSKHIKGGELGAYLQTRDAFLSDIKANVDQMASQFAESVNATNRSSYNMRGEPGGNVFHFSPEVGASKTLKISEDLVLNPNLLSGASKQGAVGDNRGFLALADLEGQKLMGGEKTLHDFNTEMIGRIGIEAKSAQETLEAQEGIYTQLENLREEESGVSLDEEAMNMVKYQKAFDASAKIIQVADSLLETVLSLKRF